MPTVLDGGRGQVVVKGHAVTAEWQGLMKAAAARQNQTTAEFIVAVTTDRAQEILSGTVKARHEDLASGLQELASKMAALQEAVTQGQERLAERVGALERGQTKTLGVIEWLLGELRRRRWVLR